MGFSDFLEVCKIRESYFKVFTHVHEDFMKVREHAVNMDEAKQGKNSPIKG